MAHRTTRFALTALACIGLLAAAAAAAEPAPPFKDYASRDGRFEVKFPGAPTTDTLTIQMRGVTIAIHMTAVDQGESGFVVNYCDLPVAALATGKTADQDLDDLRDRTVATLGARLVRETKGTMDGSPGRELELAAPGGNVVCRIFFIGPRLYQVMAAGPNITAATPEVRTFFDSFRLTK